jgi:hypothetical protein
MKDGRDLSIEHFLIADGHSDGGEASLENGAAPNGGF